MEDNVKQVSSYQLDQEILDARGINMTVEDVGCLPTTVYSERVHALKLNSEDTAFLKSMRRRIKNRMASQNARRRNVENLRRLARELRAVRSCRDDAGHERRLLRRQRAAWLARTGELRAYLVRVLEERSDPTEVPEIDITFNTHSESQSDEDSMASKEETEVSPIGLKPDYKPSKIELKPSKVELKPSKTECIPSKTECIPSKMEFKTSKMEFKPLKTEFKPLKTEFKPLKAEFCEESSEKGLFECSLEKLVQQSVNHLYKDDKKVRAKTVFITNDSSVSSVVSSVSSVKSVYDSGVKDMYEEEVVNLSLKGDGRRRSHGRKQSAPRKILYAYSDYEDCVLDLKVKKDQ